MCEESEVLALIAKMSELANLRDVDGLMGLYDLKATAFLFGEQVVLDEIRSHCARGYSALRGEFTYEFVPIKIETGSGIAYVIGAERIESATETGAFASTINATYCLSKIGGGWRITHQHLSMQNQGQQS